MTDPNVLNDSPSCSCSESPEAHEVAAWSRRLFLRRSIGSLLGVTVGLPLFGVMTSTPGAGLASLFAQDASVEEFLELPSNPRIKSIIMLWMDGGPSQMDTLNPKPGSANGGPIKGINTAIPGVQISEYLPRTAEMLDRFSVIRCMSTKEGNHQRARELLHTGFTPNPTVDYPALGSIFSQERGEPGAPIPQYVAIDSPGYRAGVLGMAFDPFIVRDPSKPVENLSMNKALNDARVDRRVELMKQMDARFKERLGGTSMEADGHTAIMESALRFMRAEEAAAFDVSKESQAVRSAYGETKFGQGCLMARRLVESGVKFVEVSLGGWDTHEDNFTRVGSLCSQVDMGMTSLIRDLEERKLLDSTLVLWMGEFGRTPKINDKEGRDHFPGGWSVALAGAGIKRGTVLGETNSDGTEVLGSKVTTADLFRTILWSSGIDPEYEYYSPKGRPMKYADDGRIIKEIVTT